MYQKLWNYHLNETNVVLDRGELLPKAEIKMERTGARYEMLIDAPREFVWEIRFGPDYVIRAFKPGYRTKSLSFEYREGGKIKMVKGNDEGDEYREEGTFVAVKPRESLVWVLSSDSIPGFRIKVNESFEDHRDGTKYTVIVNFDNEEIFSKTIKLDWDKKFGEHL